MPTTKLEIRPDIKVLNTTQRFSLLLSNGNKIETATIKITFNYDVPHCVNITNASVVPTIAQTVNFKLYTYSLKTELVLQINGPIGTTPQALLRFDMVPLQSCKLKTKFDTITFKTKSSTYSKRIYGKPLSLKIQGQPIFADTVTVTTTPTAHGIELPKKHTPTPRPPKNWNSFITTNIIILAIITTLVWLAFRIKNNSKAGTEANN